MPLCRGVRRASFHVTLSEAKGLGEVGMGQYYVYIMTNRSGTLYTGITNDLARRVREHKEKLVEGFTARYNIRRLVFCEATNNVQEAIAREKQIKGWVRRKKIALIEGMNPGWEDLGAAWFGDDGAAFG